MLLLKSFVKVSLNEFIFRIRDKYNAEIYFNELKFN